MPSWEIMDLYKKKKLHNGHGHIVRSRRQALAILESYKRKEAKEGITPPKEHEHGSR